MFRRNKDKPNMAPAPDSKASLPLPSKIPRSRTFNVLSSMTPSFLRSAPVVVDEEAQIGIEEVERDFPQPTLTKSSFTRPDLRRDAMLGTDYERDLSNHQTQLEPRTPPTRQSPTPSSPFQDFINDSSESHAKSEHIESRDSESHDSFFSLGQQSRTSSPVLEAFPSFEEEDNDEPARIHEAQCSAYWTGRFVGVRDHLHNETHEEQKNLIIQLSPEQYSLLFNDSSDAVSSSSEQLTRAKRVFTRLELLCATEEAKGSLHAWQQEYARVVKAPWLLPPGGSMGVMDEVTKKFQKHVSPRKSSVPTYAPRNSSFGAAIAAEKRKNGAVAEFDAHGREVHPVDPREPRAGVIPLGTSFTSTRIPSPTYAKTTRRNVSGQLSPQPPRYEITDKYGRPFVLRKTSMEYAPNVPTARPDEGTRRGASFGITRDPNSSSNLRPSLGLTRDTYSSNNLRPSLGLTRDTYSSRNLRPSLGPDTSIPNLSKTNRYQPRVSLERPGTTRRVTPRNDNMPSAAGNYGEFESKIHGSGLPRDRTVRDFSKIDTSANSPLSKKYPPLSSRDMTATPKMRKEPYLPASSSMNFPVPPIPRDRTLRNLTDATTAYTTVKRPLPVPLRGDSIPRSFTSNDLASRTPSHTPGINNNTPRYDNRSSNSKTPTSSRKTSLLTSLIPPTPRHQVPKPHYYPPPSTTPTNQLHSKKSQPRSANQRTGISNSTSKANLKQSQDESLVYEAADDDIDVWNSEHSKPKVRKSGGGFKEKLLGLKAGITRSTSSNNSIPSPMNTTTKASGTIDELGNPHWDARGFPYYLYDGDKKFYVYSKIPDVFYVDGGGGVVNRVITEEREVTWGRLKEKREERGRVDLDGDGDVF